MRRRDVSEIWIELAEFGKHLDVDEVCTMMVSTSCRWATQRKKTYHEHSNGFDINSSEYKSDPSMDVHYPPWRSLGV